MNELTQEWSIAVPLILPQLSRANQIKTQGRITAVTGALSLLENPHQGWTTQETGLGKP